LPGVHRAQAEALDERRDACLCRRIRDPADERQVRVSLTSAGRRLLENDLGRVLVDACGLGDEFSVVQKNVVRLRDNLLRNARGKQDA
jgi:DNA-binding MarR family transcriptional regulator